MEDPDADLELVLASLERQLPARLPPDLGSHGRMHVYVFDDIVVKFDGRLGSAAMVRERCALELLARSTLPVPKLIAAGDFTDGRRWVVLTRLSGEPPQDAEHPAHDVSPAVARQMGGVIAQLHTAVVPPGFGTWERHPGLFLVEEEARRAESLISLGRERQLVPANELDALVELMKLTRASLVTAPSRPVLAHRDVQPRNVLVEAGHISGLLDFEAAAGGDPAEDFNVLGLDWSAPGFKAYVEGYRDSGGSLGPDAPDRVAHYVLRWSLVVFVYLAGFAPQYLAPARTAVERVRAGERPNLRQ